MLCSWHWCFKKPRYFCTTWGSWHCSCWAINFVGQYSSPIPNAEAGRSIHKGRWLLGTPAANDKYPPLTNGTKAWVTNILSIGALPQLCVAGANIPGIEVRTMYIFKHPKNALIHANLTSSLKSIIKIKFSPSSCHCWISFTKSLRIAVQGHSLWQSCTRPLTCCW